MHEDLQTDEDYMRQALGLARRGSGHVNPNPLVGAVIVKNQQIIARGWHARYGEPHAERQAFANLADPDAARGATLYVTLEPCCHYGKQPPCTDAIIAHGIARVVIGHGDPNPLVAGKGLDILRAHGITVTEHVLEADCARINEIFFYHIQTGRPYVMLKYAMTLDGKIATRTGASRWITGDAARRRVHEDRTRYMAIAVGLGTVLADDPRLTSRLTDGQGRDPIRIICDSHLATPLTAAVVRTAGQPRTILATTVTDSARAAPYLAAGCEVLSLPADSQGQIQLTALIDRLAADGIDSLIIEGGATLAAAALAAGIVNKISAFIAPKIFGGEASKTPVAGRGVATPDGAYELSSPVITRLGPDLLLESEVKK